MRKQTHDIDELLRTAAKRLPGGDMDRLPPEHAIGHVFSSSFERKMNRLTRRRTFEGGKIMKKLRHALPAMAATLIILAGLAASGWVMADTLKNNGVPEATAGFKPGGSPPSTANAEQSTAPAALPEASAIAAENPEDVPSANPTSKEQAIPGSKEYAIEMATREVLNSFVAIKYLEGAGAADDPSWFVLVKNVGGDYYVTESNALTGEHIFFGPAEKLQERASTANRSIKELFEDDFSPDEDWYSPRNKDWNPEAHFG